MDAIPSLKKPRGKAWRLLKACGVVAFAFAAMGLLVALALNLSFLNPVAQIMKGFSLTDIYYHVLQEYGTADTSRVVTIVDMTDLTDRGRIADVLGEIDSLHPKGIGVDIVFEGWKPDTLGDMRMMEVADGCNSVVFSYRLRDYVNDSIGYAEETHSFFADVVPIKEGFTNYERSLYGGIKRTANLALRSGGVERHSFVYELAQIYTDGHLKHGLQDLNINFRTTVFRVIPADSVRLYADYIHDHIVLYGAYREMNDMHYTPLGEIPGIELLAYSIQTLLEQTEVHHPSLLVTIVMSFLVVLITYIWRSKYLQWAKSRKSGWVSYFLTTTFLVGLLMFIWTAVLVGVAFLIFCLTGVSLNLGWALGAIPFLGGAKEFFSLTARSSLGK